MMISLFEDFKKKVQEMGFDKVFKMSAATNEGVDDVIKEAARMLKEIPITELEIAEDESIYQKKRDLLMTLQLRKMEKKDITFMLLTVHL